MSRHTGNLVIGRGQCRGFLVDKSTLETRDSVSNDGAPRSFDELANEIAGLMKPRGEIKMHRSNTRDEDKELLALVERLTDAVERLTNAVERETESRNGKRKAADSSPANPGHRQLAEFESLAGIYHRRDIREAHIDAERLRHTPQMRDARDGTAESDFVTACERRRRELLQ